MRKLTRRHFVGSTLAGAAMWLAGSRRAQAAIENDAVAGLLNRKVLDEGVPGEQVRQFCEQRVPAMPEVESVEQWREQAERIRQRMFNEVIFTGEARNWRQTPGGVEWSDTIECDGYVIRKVRYEALPGYWIPGLLYEPNDLSGRVPVIFCTHGHVGPGGGKARPVVQRRCINFVRRGVLAFTADWPDIGQLHAGGRHYRMHQLELCGTAGVAPFYLCLERAIDLLLEHPHVDPERLCVNGQSGGGWQTVFISALDERVKLANPVAGHSSLLTRARYDSDLGDGEQQPNDMATVADYTHLTAMVAPRPQLLTFNANDDCCFATAHALPPLMDAAEPIYNLHNAAHHLRTHNNMVVAPEPRGHNFGRENREALYRMLGTFFHDGDPSYPRQDFDIDDEMQDEDALNVDLPEDNHDFNSMARQLMTDLPRDPDVPDDPQRLRQWQQDRRPLLREIVSFHDYAVQPERVDEHDGDGVRATHWRLRMGEAWDVPAMELTPSDGNGDVEGTVVLLADAGRAEAGERVAELLGERQRVIALDPFYFGESELGSRDFLLALLVACVGERPLGIQASQVAAVCRWVVDRHGQPPRVVSVGPRTGIVSLVAAGIEAEAVAGLDQHEPLESLKQIIERDRFIQHSPELFCFGLLERFDVPQLQALVEPRPVVRHG